MFNGKRSKGQFFMQLALPSHAAGSRFDWQARMPASTVAARFQRASEGGILPPIVKAVPGCMR
jgi:hypothetical protein